MRFYARFILTLSAFSPALVLYSLFNYWYTDIIPYILSAAAAIMVGFSLYLIRYSSKHGPSRPTNGFKSVKNTDQEILVFLFSYILPALPELSTQTTGGLPDKILIIIFIIILFTMFASNSYHYNPVLAMFGYHFYEAGTDDGATLIMITRKPIFDLLKIRNISFITEVIITETEKNK